ncbi:MAG: DUF1330 domain-containing protein [Ancalomicrobiaceae bacterium]|nr:DUF1330 domain-containing protein [Ancalomicrobiaceae bacterium]
MPKAYWIAHIDVADHEGYKGYLTANAEPFRKFGARFVVRAGRGNVVEGAFAARHIVLEFPDYKSAIACYESPEYQRAKAIREAASTADLIIIEGYDGPQPGD